MQPSLRTRFSPRSALPPGSLLSDANPVLLTLETMLKKGRERERIRHWVNYRVHENKSSARPVQVQWRPVTTRWQQALATKAFPPSAQHGHRFLERLRGSSAETYSSASQERRAEVWAPLGAPLTCRQVQEMLQAYLKSCFNQYSEGGKTAFRNP